MCGIAGIAGQSGISADDRSSLGAMLDRLAHRGPDDQGRHDDPFVTLGHRRLAIVDRSGGHQPISNEDKTIWVVANGEIFNFGDLRRDLLARGHRFSTQGDIECLVHLYEEYGDDCVQHASGMFAFAIWDSRRKRLLLARDRLGVKPLYYTFDDERLIFASELKAVHAAPHVPRVIELTGLFDYLTFGFIPSPKSIFRDVFKVPPSSLLVYENGRTKVSQYWDLHHRGWSGQSAEDNADMLWAQLHRATQRRMVAEVPLGLFLSGGADSAAVAACMADLSTTPINTFTCGFAHQGFDERAPSRQTAELVGSNHREAQACPDFGGELDRLAWHFDEPFADASAIAMYSLAREASKHGRVMLSGDGGDEALAGYRRYRFDLYESRVRRLIPSAARRLVFGPLGRVYPAATWAPRPLRVGATLRNLAVDNATGHGRSIATMSGHHLTALVSDDLMADRKGYDPLQIVRTLYEACDAPDHLSRCQYVDIRLGLADGMLTKVDRAAMAHGLEVRSPMLDYEFVETAWSIPPGQRISGGYGKHPLRMALDRRLGPDVAWRKKAGFEVPLDRWCRGLLRERIEDDLLQPSAAINAYVNPERVRRIWSQHQTGSHRHGPTLWKLLMLETWLQGPLQVSRFARAHHGLDTWHARPVLST